MHTRRQRCQFRRIQGEVHVEILAAAQELEALERVHRGSREHELVGGRASSVDGSRVHVEKRNRYLQTVHGRVVRQ